MVNNYLSKEFLNNAALGTSLGMIAGNALTRGNLGLGVSAFVAATTYGITKLIDDSDETYHVDPTPLGLMIPMFGVVGLGNPEALATSVGGWTAGSVGMVASLVVGAEKTSNLKANFSAKHFFASMAAMTALTAGLTFETPPETPERHASQPVAMQSIPVPAPVVP